MAPVEDTPLIETARLEWLVVETVDEITRNWGWILAFGLFNLLFGVVCLCYPVLASEVVELALTYTVLLAGCIHLSAACCFAGANGSARSQLLIMGLVQIFIAFLMFIHPLGVLAIITFFVVVVFMSAGLFQLYLARSNPNLAARGLTVLSGVLAIALSLIVIVGMPASSWYTIGILIGVNHVNVGISRLIISFYGFRLSREESRSVLPAWMT